MKFKARIRKAGNNRKVIEVPVSVRDFLPEGKYNIEIIENDNM